MKFFNKKQEQKTECGIWNFEDRIWNWIYSKFYLLNFKFNPKAFTLIETMVGIVIIVTAITGPLSLAVSSATYARDTKDKMTAIYLAQEVADILRFERDSLLIKCNQNIDTVCHLQDLGLGDGSFESPSNAAWRMFKNNLKSGVVDCFIDPITDVGTGCAFDFYDFTNQTRFPVNLPPLAPTRYSPSDPGCNYLYRNATSASNGGAYLCKGSDPLFTDAHKTKFSRLIKLKSIKTVDSLNDYFIKYNDDVRVSVTVSYTKSTGFPAKTVEVVDFLHAKI